jgi:hypothetical protein
LALERERERPFPRRLARELVAPKDAVVVLVLGDVREVREVAEGTDDRDRGLHVERVEPLGQRRARRRVAVAAKAHRVLPDVLDDLEDLRPLVRADGVAQHAPEHADVLAQRRVSIDGGRDDASVCRGRRAVRRRGLLLRLGLLRGGVRLLCARRCRALSQSVHESGCPVDSTTAIQRSPLVSTCLRYRVASAIGTCTKRPCHRPISISVLPAIAACTALRAMFQQ